MDDINELGPKIKTFLERKDKRPETQAIPLLNGQSIELPQDGNRVVIGLEPNKYGKNPIKVGDVLYAIEKPFGVDMQPQELMLSLQGGNNRVRIDPLGFLQVIVRKPNEKFGVGEQIQPGTAQVVDLSGGVCIDVFGSNRNGPAKEYKATYKPLERPGNIPALHYQEH